MLHDVVPTYSAQLACFQLSPGPSIKDSYLHIYEGWEKGIGKHINQTVTVSVVLWEVFFWVNISNFATNKSLLLFVSVSEKCTLMARMLIWIWKKFDTWSEMNGQMQLHIPAGQAVGRLALLTHYWA